MQAALAGTTPESVVAAFGAAAQSGTRLPTSLDFAAVYAAREQLDLLTSFHAAVENAGTDADLQISDLGDELLSAAPDLLSPLDRAEITLARRRIGHALRLVRAHTPSTDPRRTGTDPKHLASGSPPPDPSPSFSPTPPYTS